MFNPGELVESAASIISLPDIYFRVSRLIDEPGCTSARLAEVIAYDPGLTARVLKMANGAYYGRTQRVETVAQAITLIGTGDLRHLVLATSATQAFRNITNTVIDMDTFWQHSVCCALAARALAAHCQPHHRERSFVAGLLHDVGQLLICHQIPDAAKKIQERWVAQGSGDRYRLEQEELGFTHADVGAELLKSWELPVSLWEAVECHHNPADAKLFPVDAALIHVADALANAMNLEAKTFGQSEAMHRVDARAWAVCRQQEESVLETVATEVHAQWFEVFEVIWPGANLIY